MFLCKTHGQYGDLFKSVKSDNGKMLNTPDFKGFADYAKANLALNRI